MGADKSAKYTPNAQNLFAQLVCPSPKVLDFNEKDFIGHPQFVVHTIITFISYHFDQSIHPQISKGQVTWLPEASTIDKIDHFDMIEISNSDHCGKFA